MTRQKSSEQAAQITQALHLCPVTHVSFLASASAAEPMWWALFCSSWWEWREKRPRKEDSQMGGINGGILVVAESGAGGISVIHQPELITSEPGVSWQDAAPAAITIRNGSRRPGGRWRSCRSERQRPASRTGKTEKFRCNLCFWVWWRGSMLWLDA